MVSLKRSSGAGKKMNGIVTLNNVLVKKLQRSLLSKKKWSSHLDGNDHRERSESSSTYVPDDVKEGEFAVVAVGVEEEPKRFVVPLSYLGNPMFVRLLELAAEEYGFCQEGALTLPCRPSVIERMLAGDDDDFQQCHFGVTCP
ncbi:hypothetical protein Tsubulata_007480 [Turnera subulata]|uniref:Uncharacterized protein n=1 Tax=Turnera subulata TaxID=218843 RepID=A0A9Q0FDU1_9ROSI|nr:hypothetical protein Tsubulata_007480 [Turnera subulata]